MSNVTTVFLTHCFGEASEEQSPLSFGTLGRHIEAIIKDDQEKTHGSQQAAAVSMTSRSTAATAAAAFTPASSTSTNPKPSSNSPFVPNLKSGFKSLLGEKKPKISSPQQQNNNTSSNVPPEAVMNGRIGLGDNVGLQQHSLDVVPGNNLAIIGNNNFQSVKASHCVYKGKWMYEVLLGTSGLMQVGWCLASCKFNREEGVGDTKDSYAFDGYREARWNGRSSTKYGMAWEADDVVTCLLDLDDRKCSFMLNGKDMGIAFTNISIGPGFAYFPGLSLAFKEIAYCNFGTRPFTYPVEGYQPLQAPPHNMGEARYIARSLQQFCCLPTQRPDIYQQISNAHRNIVLCHIMARMCPLMKTVYNVDAYFLPFLLLITPHECEQDPSRLLPSNPGVYKELHDVLSALWEYSDVRDAKEIINLLFASVIRNYRATPTDLQLNKQIQLLLFVQGILLHKQTKRNIAFACSYPFLYLHLCVLLLLLRV